METKRKVVALLRRTCVFRTFGGLVTYKATCSLAKKPLFRATQLDRRKRGTLAVGIANCWLFYHCILTDCRVVYACTLKLGAPLSGDRKIGALHALSNLRVVFHRGRSSVLGAAVHLLRTALLLCWCISKIEV